MRRRGLAFGGAVILAVVLAIPPASAARPRAQVTRVTDGDTVYATWNGQEDSIRLLGVDTPETVHPTEPVECFGPQASAFTKRKLEGASVRLEFDEERYDRYDRTLAYIWRGKRLFNVTLVRRGYATVLIYQPNDKYADRLYRAQDFARARDRGLWGACPESSDDEGGSGDVAGGGSGGGVVGGGTGETSGGGGGCDPSYPDVCIPPPPLDSRLSRFFASAQVPPIQGQMSEARSSIDRNPASS